MTIRNLEFMLKPRSVAFIGASPAPGSVGNIVSRNLLAGGFKGPIWLVNPRHRSIEGQQTFATAAELPQAPDLAVIATPPQMVPRLVAELGAKGTRAVVVVTAGLDQTARQAMLDAARPHLLRIQGPNCIGLMLPEIGLNASFSHQPPLAGDLALLSQSGALVTSMIDWANSRSIGFSHVVSLGDMADVDFGDLLDFLAADTSSRAILLYMESVSHAPKFLSAARRAARAKPVIVIKAGRHVAGARAAKSHTGALAGSDSAYGAAFRRAGLLRVRELKELFDAAEMLSRVPRLSGERLMVLTNGGGAGVLAADRLADWDGVLAPLADDVRAELDAVLPATWSKANPVDIIGDATPERYGKAVDVLMRDKGSDALLILNCPTALADSSLAASATLEAIGRRRPSGGRKIVLTNWLGNGAAEPARRLFRENAIPAFESPDDAIDGFMQLVRYSRAQTELMRTPPSLPALSFDVATAESTLTSAIAARQKMLPDVAVRSLLEAYRIPVLPSEVAETPDDVSETARAMLQRHSAVAVKILSEDISHKSDVGGVVLDLESADAAREAAVAILERVKSLRRDARVSGFTVQPMVRRPHAHELIAGASVDETFGPLITFGAGGTAVEVMRDTAQALPPLDLGLAIDLMRQTRTYRLLSGYRDRPAANLDAIALVLVNLSYLVSRHPEIREIDINPLLADESGAIALDARVAIADPIQLQRTPMAIRAYPSEWESDVSLNDGLHVRIRPIRPDDEIHYSGFLKGVSADDLRLRFFTPRKEFSHAFVARLTQIDYAREMAFVALDAGIGELLGVVRFTADPDYKRGEFAILVRSALKGRGLGWALMQHLIRYATAEGLEALYGQILAENETMLRMCRELGFAIVPEPGDMSLRQVSLSLRTG